MRSALGAGHSVNLVQDKRLDAAQNAPRLRGQQQEERLGRRGGESALEPRSRLRPERRQRLHGLSLSPVAHLTEGRGRSRRRVCTFGTKLAQTRAFFVDTIESGWWDGVPRAGSRKSRVRC